MNSNRFARTMFKDITTLKMANTWSNVTQNDIQEYQTTHEDITERTPLKNNLHNCKGFQEHPRIKQEPFGLRKGKRNTRKE